MFNQRDVECMSHALRLAKQGIYTTRPNPNVGCVITNSEGHIVGEGYHQIAGEPHAEIHAIQQAGDMAKGGTAYVTLEPCCHQGKTGPCTQALIDAGIKKVIISMRDPNPLVSGKGLETLIQHGVKVEEGLLNQQSQQLNRGFIKRMTQGLPWITAKIATSYDGRTALSNGKSKWITSQHSRHDVQKLRASNDAIMTGVGTVLADNPSLNVRITKEQLNTLIEPLQPIRIIIDPELKMPEDAKMLSLLGTTVIFSSNFNDDKFKNNSDCQVIPVNSDQGKFDLREVLKHLAEQEINSVLVESGATLLGQLLNAQLVDELIHYMAPTLMGNHAKGMFDTNEIFAMDECITLDQQDVRQVGMDLKITSLIKY